tara:strand:- start:418 stop:687 length:270 start_codon:yes stop_codon:yes gene_type:complete
MVEGPIGIGDPLRNGDAIPIAHHPASCRIVVPATMFAENAPLTLAVNHQDNIALLAEIPSPPKLVRKYSTRSMKGYDSWKRALTIRAVE